jgi:hypothetical protein
MKNLILFQILLSFLVLSPVAMAADSDSDGSDSSEELLAGTSDNDATERPYWMKTWSGANADESLGESVGTTGDVDGDGYDDFVVGIPGKSSNGSNSGMVRVYSGATLSPIYSISGNALSDLGKSVAGAGDVNGDGYMDFIAGAYRDDNNGQDSG